MAEPNIDSFSTFLGTIDPGFSTEQVKSSPTAASLGKVELRVLGAVAEHDDGVRSSVLASEVELGLVELAKILADLESKKLITIQGTGGDETVLLTGDPSTPG